MKKETVYGAYPYLRCIIPARVTVLRLCQHKEDIQANFLILIYVRRKCTISDKALEHTETENVRIERVSTTDVYFRMRGGTAVPNTRAVLLCLMCPPAAMTCYAHMKRTFTCNNCLSLSNRLSGDRHPTKSLMHHLWPPSYI
jgi:hypothetical protein